MKKGFQILLIILVFFASCQKQAPDFYESTWEQACDNNGELKKVADYYKNPEDSLKKRAALFLIENMYPHHAIRNEESEGLSQVFDELREMSVKETGLPYAMRFERFAHRFDSLTQL